MWMTSSVSTGFQNQYKIKTKISDYKGGVDVELFSSDALEQVALIDYKSNSEVLVRKFSFIQSEMVSMIPFCVCENAKRALVCGSINAEIAYYLALQNVSVDMVVSDKESLFALSGFFPHFKEVINNQNVKVYDNFLELEYPKYDIVIHLGAIKLHEFDALKRMVSKDSALIFRLHNLYFEPRDALQTLQNASDFGKILMPFMIPSLITDFYGYLSNSLHPLADLRLQKSDMLENLQFYNSNLHQSVFRLPVIIQNLVARWVRN